MDTVTPSERSRIMASVRSKGNKSTECAIISLLKKERVSGWRRNYLLLGKPDFVFPQKKITLFIDGCLWHGCQQHCRIPRTNRRYWTNKIVANMARDISVRKELRAKGWTVLRIWEHDIKTGSAIRKIRKIKKTNSKRRIQHTL